MIELKKVAKWLTEIGYGLDFTNRDAPLPEELRKPLAQAWFENDAIHSDETVEDYYDMLADELGW